MASFKDSIVNYVQESYQELRKVTWPTRLKAVRLTFIVLGFCVVMSAVLGVLDLGFNFGYQSLVDYAAKVAPPAPITEPAAEVPPVTVTQEKINTQEQKTSEVKTSSTTQTTPSL